MPDFPIIDTHLHVWDQTRLKYSALRGQSAVRPSLSCRGLPARLRRRSRSRRWCSSNATPTSGTAAASTSRRSSSSRTRPERDPRIKAHRADGAARMGQGGRSPCSSEMRDKHPTVKGIRRIVEFDADPRALTLSDGFVEGVNLLDEFGWHFEINVNHTQMDIVREFVQAHARRADDPRPLRQARHQGRRHRAVPRRRARARQAPEPVDQALRPAGRGRSESWTEADLRPYIEATLEAFGPDAHDLSPATIRSACRRRP